MTVMLGANPNPTKLFSCFWREQYDKVVANYGAGHAPFKLCQVFKCLQ